jgi:glycosyltransferase involved in cell wall biosynthesis
MQRAADRLPWLQYYGPKTGAEKAEIVAQAQLMLMPGLVGLVIVETFAALTPLVTTNFSGHSPEIEYAEHAVNSFIIDRDPTPSQYANEVAKLLGSQEALERLREGCRRSASVYTLDNMVENFASGIHEALSGMID